MIISIQVLMSVISSFVEVEVLMNFCRCVTVVDFDDYMELSFPEIVSGVKLTETSCGRF